jgi:hypothetical protein
MGMPGYGFGMGMHNSNGKYTYPNGEKLPAGVYGSRLR